MTKLEIAATAAIALLSLVVVLGTHDMYDNPQVAQTQEPATSPDWTKIKANHPSLPPPIGHVLSADAEEMTKAGRKRWFKERHRAAEDLDWEEIERRNGFAQTAKRNQLAWGQLDDPATALATRRAAKDAPAMIPTWVERGSVNQAGRMHAATHASNHASLYAGSAGGGVWKGELDGSDWEPIGDNLFGGSHKLVVVPGVVDGDPDIVLTAARGRIHRSDDDGATWVMPEGVFDTWSVRRLITTSDGSSVIFTVLSDYWESSYLLRSTDRGATFENVFEMTDYKGDVWIPRDGSSTVYMFTGGSLMISEDLGDSWTTVGAIGEPSSQAELVGSEAGAPRLWVVLRNADTGTNALYRSDNAGADFTFVIEVTDYWGSLNASVHEADIFAWGGVEVYRTANGGADFAKVNEWGEYYGDTVNKLHADVPGIDVVLDGAGAEIWYICTDGGLYRSDDALASVKNVSLEGLRVSQYYSTLTSSTNPDHIAAGSQDQGYQLTNTIGPQTSDILEFDQVLSGDYGHLVSGDGSHEYVFSVYPGFVLVQVEMPDPTDPPFLFYLDFPASENYAWLPPLCADPQANEDFFFPATRLYHYAFNGQGWDPVIWSSLDVSTYGEGVYLSALAFSKIDPQRAYAATNDGRLFYSLDRGVTWTPSASLGPEAHYFYGTALLPSDTDVDTVYAAGSGYGVPAVYRSEDGGQTFFPWSEGLPDTLVYSLSLAPDGSGRLFAGTETSAYERAPDTDGWIDITGADAPITTYWSAEALTAENTIRFGTYGRGIWDYQLDPDHLGCFPVQDFDGDGVNCDEDCDDHDGALFPGNTEACDGVDANCDPADLVEVDQDQDGYLACAECDDGDPEINPQAVEVCGNDIDEDCSGLADPCEDPVFITAVSSGCSCGATGQTPGTVGFLFDLFLRLL